MCQPSDEWRVLEEVSELVERTRLNSFSIIWQNFNVFCPIYSIYVQGDESYAFAKSSHSLSYRTLGQCLTLSSAESELKSLLQLTEINSFKGGSKTAITSVHENVSKSFQELEDDSNQLANALRSQLSLKKGDVIGLWTGNSVSCIVTQFAAAKLGLIVCTINPNYKGLELEFALQKAGVKTLICPGKDSPQESVNKFFEIFQSLDTSRIPTLKNVILLDGDKKKAKGDLGYFDLKQFVSGASTQFQVKEGESVQADDATIIMFTSGTTGKPKGAVLSHFNLVNNSILTGHRLGLDQPSSKACIPVPLFHIFGMVYGSVMMAATKLEIVLTGYKYSSHAVIDAISKHNCSHVMIVPAMTVDIINLVEKSQQQLPSLKGVITGSAPTPLEVALNFPRKVPSLKQFMIRFGSTETGGCMSMPLEGDPPGKSADNVGAPLDLTEMKIVDTKTGAVVKIGQSGEVWARGHNVMKGYWNDPDKTREAIEDGWFKTG